MRGGTQFSTAHDFHSFSYLESERRRGEFDMDRLCCFLASLDVQSGLVVLVVAVVTILIVVVVVVNVVAGVVGGGGNGFIAAVLSVVKFTIPFSLLTLPPRPQSQLL